MERLSAICFRLVAVMLVLLAAGTAYAAPAKGDLPQMLRIPGLESEDRPGYLILGWVYPLGWSPEGLFAYVYEPADEACGCYFFELIVQDLRSDRIVWRYEYTSGKYQLDDLERFDGLEEIWKGKGEQFAAKLRELGIVRRDDTKLELFAASPAKLKVELATREAGDDIEYFRHISRYTVELSGPQGSKIIFRSDRAGVSDARFGPGQVKSQGYLRSPYESRIAVLLEETWRGWEAFPFVVRLRFAGADLESGFR